MRAAKLLLTKEITTNVTPLTNEGPAFEIDELEGPFELIVATEDITGSAPTGAVAFQAQLEMLPPLDAAAPASPTPWLTSTAITAVGNQEDRTEPADQAKVAPTRVQPQILATAATAWNGGTRMRVFLVGNLRRKAN